jgi:hypothetical protein
VLALGLLVSGLALVREERPIAAAVALAAASLTRETTIVVPVAALVTWFARRRPAAVVGVGPLVAFGAWQLFVASRWHVLGFQAGGSRSYVPFGGLVGALRYQLGNGDAGLRTLVDLALVAALVVMAGTRLRVSAAALHEKLALALYLAAVATLPTLILAFDVNAMRALGELIVLALVVLVGAPRDDSGPRRASWILAAVSALTLVPLLGQV